MMEYALRSQAPSGADSNVLGIALIQKKDQMQILRRRFSEDLNTSTEVDDEARDFSLLSSFGRPKRNNSLDA